MQTIKQINYLLEKKYKLYTVFVLLVIIIGSFVELLGVSMILPIVNLALDPEEVQNNIFCRIIAGLTGKTKVNEILLLIIFSTILVYILKSVYLVWMNFIINRYSMKVRTNIAMKLLTTYMKQPYSYFLHKNTSEIIRSINIDTTNFHSVISNIMYAISYGLTCAFLVLYLCKTNIRMTLMVAALLAFCAVGILGMVQKKVRKLGRENQYLVAEMIKYIEEAFTGIKEVKVLNKENFFIELCRKIYEDTANVGRKAVLYNTIPKHLIEAVSIIGILMYMVINIVGTGNFTSLIPQLSVFAVAAIRLLPSVNALYAYINAVAYNRASVELLYNDVKESESLQDVIFKGDADEEWNLRDKIEVRDVCFAYNETTVVLDGINLEIAAGTSVALIGTSGGGKTTLADVVLGVLTPQSGKVLVDGKDISGHEQAWHKCIGYIPQSIFLLDDSIKHNVAFGVEDAEIDEEKVINCLKKAQLWDFVSQLKDGIHAAVGERGTCLSGGQRQRIGIARALYEDPKVLIFDEATSALDNATEREVMQAIDGLHGEKTILMIAHRLSTIENCDHIYKVENHHLEKVR